MHAAPAAALAAAATRHSDATPWSAGAELVSPGNAFCSSGFGAWRDKTAVLLTTARRGASGLYKTGTGPDGATRRAACWLRDAQPLRSAVPGRLAHRLAFASAKLAFFLSSLAEK
ncbi:hypothetical protein [Kitasatospora sp. NPDC089509]|uniref:hypothetical protein n=1 Tax=Kitasatospora sp. NPDC089509 TaxID=3364079 RepID=UPI00383091BC